MEIELSERTPPAPTHVFPQILRQNAQRQHPFESLLCNNDRRSPSCSTLYITSAVKTTSLKLHIIYIFCILALGTQTLINHYDSVP